MNSTARIGLCVCLFLIAGGGHALFGQRNYSFDGKISREVLENYLSRSITMTELYRSPGNLDDDTRMLKNIGAKPTTAGDDLSGPYGDIHPADLHCVFVH